MTVNLNCVRRKEETIYTNQCLFVNYSLIIDLIIRIC
nr:MAG TPA: hypothetical protein [Caudoviricetes sp.]